jgi:hypothetical protein
LEILSWIYHRKRLQASNCVGALINIGDIELDLSQEKAAGQ